MVRLWCVLQVVRLQFATWGQLAHQWWRVGAREDHQVIETLRLPKRPLPTPPRHTDEHREEGTHR